MVSKGLFALVIIGFGFFTLSVMILPISNQVNELRTDSQTDTALACTTGAAATDAGAGAMPLLAPVARCSPPWLLKEARLSVVEAKQVKPAGRKSKPAIKSAPKRATKKAD